MHGARFAQDEVMEVIAVGGRLLTSHGDAEALVDAVSDGLAFKTRRPRRALGAKNSAGLA